MLRILLQLAILLIESTVDIVLLLFSHDNWDLRSKNAVIEWRNTLHGVSDDLQVINHLECIDLVISTLNDLCWALDLGVIPSWTRSMFIDAFSQPNHVGRPRLFQQYAPIIRFMITHLRYTNRETRDALAAFGVGEC